ncbi:Bax inhibitor-1/YccA family protein [Dermabacteraceae bacterium P7074]
MARHNTVLGNDKRFQPNPYADFSAQRRAAAPQYQYPQQSAPQYGQSAPQQPTAEELNMMYARPAANSYDTDRMSYDDVLSKSSIVFGVITLLAVATASLPIITGILGMGQSVGYGLASIATFVGMIGALVVGLIVAFKRVSGPGLILAYSVFEGMFLGGISMFFETRYPGIVLQAVIATLATSAAVLLLFRSGKVRTSPRLNKIFFVAMLGYLLFSLVNLVLMLTGVVGGEFGLRSGVFGLAIGALAVLMASYSLVMDFEDIKNGVNNGVPRNTAWLCAFSLAVTIVWMYVEFLRILAILRSND